MSNILVVGSLNTDFVIDVDSIVTPGETLLGHSSETHYGGKGANQAVALSRLGAKVSMQGAVGNDSEGQALKQALHKEGINTEGIQTLENTLSGKAFIQRTKTDNAIVVTSGANMAFDIPIDNFTIEAYDMIVLQNEIPMALNKKLIEKAHLSNVMVLYNPAPARQMSEELLGKIDWLVLNESEANSLTAQKAQSTKTIDSILRTLNKTVKHAVVLTRGARGVSYIINSVTHHEKAFNITPLDTTGAGDAFVAGLAYALSNDYPMHECINLAQKCGALAATKKGAQPSFATMNELLNTRFNY